MNYNNWQRYRKENHAKSNAVRILAVFTIAVLILVVLSINMVSNGNRKDSISAMNSNKENGVFPKFNIQSKDVVQDTNIMKGLKVRLYESKHKKTVELDLEEYIKGVVAAEMPGEFDIEALKSQAVAARTFAVAHMKEFGAQSHSSNNDADVCDAVHCQVFMEKEERMNSWPESGREELWNKVAKAVDETAGQVLTYEGKLVLEPLYFAVSSGRTEDVADVFGEQEPYLVSVNSPGEEAAPKYKAVVKISNQMAASRINTAYPGSKVTSSKLASQVKIASKSDAGGVKTIKVGKVTISGRQFRTLFNLNSTNFTISFTSKNMEVHSTGYGHGVGMSQWGTNVMAKAGKKYDEILKHYYQGVKIEKIQTSLKKSNEVK